MPPVSPRGGYCVGNGQFRASGIVEDGQSAPDGQLVGVGVHPSAQDQLVGGEGIQYHLHGVAGRGEGGIEQAVLGHGHRQQDAPGVSQAGGRGLRGGGVFPLQGVSTDLVAPAQQQLGQFGLPPVAAQEPEEESVHCWGTSWEKVDRGEDAALSPQSMRCIETGAGRKNPRPACRTGVGASSGEGGRQLPHQGLPGHDMGKEPGVQSPL